jgi:outer membrane beta-barrel protein
MARWIRFLLLIAATAVAAGCASTPRGDTSEGDPEAIEAEEEPGRIIEPAVERRSIKQPKIDTENVEIGAFAGIMSIEDFGSNPVYGIRAAYHIAEDVFVEAAVGRTEAGLSSIEELANVRVTDNRDYTYYNISFGYNFLPGEIFLGRNYALNSALYVIGGMGGTRFADDDHFTLNMGAGIRVLATDWLAFHLDTRAHRFATDLLGKNKAVYNLEGHLGFTVFF